MNLPIEIHLAETALLASVTFAIGVKGQFSNTSQAAAVMAVAAATFVAISYQFGPATSCIAALGALGGTSLAKNLPFLKKTAIIAISTIAITAIKLALTRDQMFIFVGTVMVIANLALMKGLR